MGDLVKLPNIGAELERQLHEVGINSFEDLKKTGSKETWLRILEKDPTACLMRLFALEGAIQGIRWHYLDQADKEELKVFYQKHKRG